MKKTKILFILCAALLVSCLQPLGAAALLPVQTTRTENVALGTLDASFYPSDDAQGVLSEEKKEELRAVIRTGVQQMQTDIDIAKFGLDQNDASFALIKQLVFFENPEFFHVQSSFSYSYDPSANKLLSVSLFYTMNATEYAEKLAACRAAADKLLDGIRDNDSLTDVHKALLLHDRLALHCSYGDVDGSDLDTATVYGALVGKKPICQGYAMAYLYLLGQVGIRSEYVSSKQLRHGWNIVYIDAKPYHVDVTWDDPTEDVYGRVNHNNFLLSTAALQAETSGHDATDFNSIPVDTTYDNYFWKNSQAAFQLVNGEIYYIDHTAEEIRRLSDSQKICSVADEWRISRTHLMVGNQARLSCVNDTLYCSKATAVYTVNTQNGALTQVYAPELTVDGVQYYSIPGFYYDDGNMHFRFARYENEKILYENKSFAYCQHTQTEVIGRTEPTCAADGYTGNTVCADCGFVVAYGEPVAATALHEWIPGAVLLPPTVQADGEQAYTCHVCGLYEVRSIPSLEVGFTDSESAKVKNGLVFSAAATDVKTLLQNAAKGAYVESARQERKEDGMPVGTGDVLVFADGSRQKIILLGDVDGDGAVSATDARAALRNAVHLDVFDETMKTAADADDDALITASDARSLLRAAVHLDKPTEWKAFAA